MDPLIAIPSAQKPGSSGGPWLEPDCNMASLAGRWVELVYDTAFTRDVTRPILRFVLADGVEDVVLTAASPGRGIWRGLVPSDATGLLITLSEGTASGGFRVVSLRRIGWVTAMMRVVGIREGLHGLALLRKGRLRAAVKYLRQATRATPLEDYAVWRRPRHRPPEPDGFDAPPLNMPHLRWLRADDSASTLNEAVADLDPDDLVAVQRSKETWAAEAELVVRSLAARDKADIFYADEATPGPRALPRLKPDWSPILAQSVDLIGGAWIARVRFLRATLGHVRVADLMHHVLRPDPGTAVRHIDRVLLTAPRGPRMLGTLAAPPLGVGLPSVSIILPTRDRLDLLRNCIDSLPTAGCPFELIVVDNGSSEPATLDYLRALAHKPDCRVLASPGPFNYSKLCNDAALTARGDTLLFLNNDTVGLSQGWAARLAGWAQVDDLGAIGAKLLFPDGRLQHMGVILGIDGHCNHFESHLPGDTLGYFERFDVPFEVSAVTGACQAVAKRKFDAVGGYEAQHLPVEFSDIDLCLKLDERGWRSLVEPRAVLIHHESATRKTTTQHSAGYAPQVAWFQARWQSRIRRDPYFHTTLALNSYRAQLG